MAVMTKFGAEKLRISESSQ